MYFTIHTLDGDPDELLAAKREHFDPVVAEHAPRFGAISTVTVRTRQGLTIYNLWRDGAGARAFTGLPEIQIAQQTSGLPAPSSFTWHDDADVTDFLSVR